MRKRLSRRGDAPALRQGRARKQPIQQAGGKRPCRAQDHLATRGCRIDHGLTPGFIRSRKMRKRPVGRLSLMSRSQVTLITQSLCEIYSP